MSKRSMTSLPKDWQKALGEEFDKPYYKSLLAYLKEERDEHEIFPPEDEVFSAFHLTPYKDVKVLILGQDPYHDNNQAHGLCFSVKPGIRTPPSLVNIYKEMKTDVGTTTPDHGYLVRWAEQGVLMINAVLTVRAHQPNSHKSKGWEKFTDAVIKMVSAKEDHVVFLLWGGYAKKKAKLVDKSKHTIIEGTHPSPLSAKNGFFGSKPFSAINKVLKANGKDAIDWQIPPLK